ncbi:MAG: dienelactone hydrolase family protein [Legionellaceae bacterium]|nr:dienelactone hydrolase family protein [Legionellaceae bacterium]
MHTSNYIYHHGEHELHGYLSYDDQVFTPKPAVIVVHDWSGRNDFACQKADLIAKLGYIGFAVDMYGQGRLGETNDEKQALMHPLVHDRLLLRTRIQAALDALITMDEVDNDRIAIMGFCFGGLCALDLARSGAPIVGAVSFHGVLQQATDLPNLPIQAKILALHGYSDPMATPDQVTIFCKEMTDAGADWQMHMYGQVQHSFTNPHAHDVSSGLVYNAQASRRSLQALTNFLEEIFA